MFLKHGLILLLLVFDLVSGQLGQNVCLTPKEIHDWLEDKRAYSPRPVDLTADGSSLWFDAQPGEFGNTLLHIHVKEIAAYLGLTIGQLSSMMVHPTPEWYLGCTDFYVGIHSNKFDATGLEKSHFFSDIVDPDDAASDSSPDGYSTTFGGPNGIRTIGHGYGSVFFWYDEIANTQQISAPLVSVCATMAKGNTSNWHFPYYRTDIHAGCLEAVYTSPFTTDVANYAFEFQLQSESVGTVWIDNLRKGDINFPTMVAGFEDGDAWLVLAAGNQSKELSFLCFQEEGLGTSGHRIHVTVGANAGTSTQPGFPPQPDFSTPWTALPGEVQPNLRDVVHTVWPNGPTHSSKLGGNWPAFDGSLYCDPSPSEVYTGYNDQGNRYCQPSNPYLDAEKHLLMYSGNLALVLDVAMEGGNFVPQLGGASPHLDLPIGYRNGIPFANLDASLALTCAGANVPQYLKLGPLDSVLQTGLVRQGHTMSHIIFTGLAWHDLAGAPFETSTSCARSQQPDVTNCASDFGASNWPCLDAAYPVCVGFQQGKSWGRCYTACEPTREWWFEVDMWGDQATIQLAWDSTPFAVGCTGIISLALTGEGGSYITNKTASLIDSNITIRLRPDGLKVRCDVGNDLADVTVSSGTGTVLVRETMQDVFLEVPSSTPRCSYTPCGSQFPLIDMHAVNSHPAQARTVRVSLSRNFPTRDASLGQSGTGAEITGLNVIVLDGVTKRPVGIPCQISKNWHDDASAVYAGYHGYWWTANVLIHLPANTNISLTFAITYELYGGVSAFSHAQLSIVGYSDKWLWEEAALGTGGENICFDPLGLHTRASITDIRPKLFDGDWKENVGGGDMFPLLFDETGAFQYQKAIDPLIHTSGPCLSNASYTGQTVDGALKTDVSVSGGRTDDFVRVFFHVRIRALRAGAFSRLAFFQFGSETYNKHPTFDEFVIGSGSNTTHTLPRTCSGGQSRAREHMYKGGPFQEEFSGSGPWWVSFGPTVHTPPNKATMVVGDRGFIVREFSARLGGNNYTKPSFSIVCDKLELGTPSGLEALIAGDFVNMKIELLVLPRNGEDYDKALSKSGSKTLQRLSGMKTWERVREQALGQLNVTLLSPGARVESHYPVRICLHGGTHVAFRIDGLALGYVPIVICGLPSHELPQRGLWIRDSIAGTANQAFSPVDQSKHTPYDYYQINYDRKTQTYEAVFNIELPESPSPGGTVFDFGTDPNLATYVRTDVCGPSVPYK